MEVLVFVHMSGFDRIPSLETTTLCTSMKHLYYSFNIPHGVLPSKVKHVLADTAPLCTTQIILCAHVEIVWSYARHYAKHRNSPPHFTANLCLAKPLLDSLRNTFGRNSSHCTTFLQIPKFAMFTTSKGSYNYRCTHLSQLHGNFSPTNFDLSTLQTTYKMALSRPTNTSSRASVVSASSKVTARSAPKKLATATHAKEGKSSIRVVCEVSSRIVNKSGARIKSEFKRVAKRAGQDSPADLGQTPEGSRCHGLGHRRRPREV